jgi:peptidoglycan hydrolase-like protein with peptidoglycan-binding domain
MAGTKRFIGESVGVGGKNRDGDVRVLQKLLISAGEFVKGGVDGDWGDGTLSAVQSFLKAQTPPGDKTLIEPGDEILLKIADKAKIIIPLSGGRGVAGIDALQKWFADNDINYQAGAENGSGNRCIYGVEGHTGYAVQTEAQDFRKGPVQMDCTTYANLMLSVYLYGNAHNAAYDGDCGRVGGVSSFHCARDRYGFPIIRRKDKDKAGKEVSVIDFRTADQILAATAQNGAGLYALEPAVLGSGFVKHLALLHGTTVYECSNATTPNCIKHPLTEFMDRCRRNGRFCYLFGPK